MPGREKTGIQFRKPWGRNSPRSFYLSRRELGIHYSGPNLDSGLFRVVQYRASTQVDLREKTGMTVVRVVCNERRWYIFVAPQAPLLLGTVPDEA